MNATGLRLVSPPAATLPGGTVYRLLNGHSWAAMRAFAKVWGGVPEIMDESRRTFRLFNSIYRVVECEGGWDVIEYHAGGVGQEE